MWTHQSSSRSARLGLSIGLVGVAVGVAIGFLVGTKPAYLILALGAMPILFYFFARFEQAVIGLLILRSSLDVFSSLQIPALFAIALDALTILYITVKLLTGQPVRVDKFWWFFLGWLIIQGLWVILLPLGGLGLDASFLPEAVREWVRLFTWVMVYLLVMQLKDKVPPEKFISGLFLSLVIPITVALMQMFLPSLLPPILSTDIRIRGTVGHPNSFSVYLLLFIGLSWWKLGHSSRRWLWIILLSLLTFVFAGARMLMGLVMLGTTVVILIAPRLTVLNLMGGVLFFSAILGLFASTEFGQERLSSIAQTPLINPDIDVSRAILLAQGDMNSFNWRLGQWTQLLNAWQDHSFLGYGLGLSIPVAGNGALPHNDYVRALIEGGLVGLVALFIFIGGQIVYLVNLMRRLPQGSRQYRLCWVLLAIVLSTSIGMITENVWMCTAFYFYWWAVLPTVGWDWNEGQPSENYQPVSPLSS